MKKIALLLSMLLVTMFATAAFCEDGKLIVKNAAEMPRVVKVKASVPTGYIVKKSDIVGSDSEESFEITLQRTIDYTETWHIKIIDVTGIPICDGYLLRDKNGFRVKTPGAYFTFQASGKDGVVTITK
ncbi:hypothetical protein [Desulfovibrio sp. JC010]|uniref:hypothetical protein n=1 Tax=Desulfovibrio sp. JC010 TaxID=2593641 RepID=UPI0013D02D6A|nr:hypothetical protein [Desulfovibrio sp. JC010]NDV26582.1 hypothetical protein [Desulfovibrio sp. JC010]